MFAPSFTRSLSLIGVSKTVEKGLMKKARQQYGRIIETIPELTSAMCAYDYAMAELKNTVFTREYTLASGGAVKENQRATFG